VTATFCAGDTSWQVADQRTPVAAMGGTR
jgi:hypothetical protein